MSRSNKAVPVSQPNGNGGEQTKPLEQTTFASFREMAESLIFALFLAFLIKAFEAEAFVIPTGSMAPTLKGRHKDVACQMCDFPFQVNASDEVNNNTNRRTSVQVIGGTCPHCGYTQYIGKEPSYTGDRILVSKSGFDCRDLRRWDVSVFRAPAEPKINFIKRIVGLPGERLKIEYGDLFVQKKLETGDYSEFEIVRKPLLYLNEMLQTVHDNDYIPQAMYQTTWPRSWADDLTELNQGLSAWTESEDGRSFHYSGKTVENAEATAQSHRPSLQVPIKREIDESTAGVQWLRYRHIVPSASDWFALSEGKLPAEVAQTGTVRNNPQLITDLTAYNTGFLRETSHALEDDYSRYVRQESQDQYRCLRPAKNFGLNWSGDLALFCDLTLNDLSTSGEVLFELVRGNTVFRCRLMPKENLIELEIPSVPSYPKETATWNFKAKKYKVAFMNIDEQLRLVLDGHEIEFPNEGRYDDLCRPLPDGKPGKLPRYRDPGPLDLSPAAIGVRGLSVSVDHLKIKRDIYYIAVGSHLQPVVAPTVKNLYRSDNNRCDRLFSWVTDFSHEEKIAAFFSHPDNWREYGRTNSALFELGEDHYLALGDNSGLSHDSRLWGSATVPFYVDRKYLIGKAFYVYWPHGSMIPGTNLPFIPSFNKMRHID